MQHKFGLREFGRTVLTVVGIVLLVIFGARAASQASSLTAVGGQPKQLLAHTAAGLQPAAFLDKGGFAATVAPAHEIKTPPPAAKQSPAAVQKPSPATTPPGLAAKVEQALQQPVAGSAGEIRKAAAKFNKSAVATKPVRPQAFAQAVK